MRTEGHTGDSCRRRGPTVELEPEESSPRPLEPRPLPKEPRPLPPEPLPLEPRPLRLEPHPLPLEPHPLPLEPRPLRLEPPWSLSFAGCGFQALYYVGALSCLLQRVPELVHGAERFSGASSGSLVAAALAVGVDIGDLCMDLVAMAAESRRLSVSVFHPSFSLLRRARDSLLCKLPVDAHVRATGRLWVSLTRIADRRNVMVSEFNSRQELVQVLLCSCFFPVYCGFIPPTYRGERYMDGALSNNQPLFEFRNTVTFAPFSGESDICPKETGYSFVQVCFGNVSIEVNTGNVYRVWTSFMPQAPQVLMQMILNGHTDALRFLHSSGLDEAQTQRRSLDGTLKDGTLEDSALEDGALEDAALEDGALEDGALEDGALEDGALEDGAMEDGALEDVSLEDGALEDAQMLPQELRAVLAACTSPALRPAHFSEPPVGSKILGLVLDLVLGLVLVLVWLLPLGLISRVVSHCSHHSPDSNLCHMKELHLDKNRNLRPPQDVT